jgi:hypothetical protein
MSETPADKKKVPQMLEDGLDLEMKPADARKYLERGFEVLADMAEDEKRDAHDRFHALNGIQAYYSMIIMKDGLDESVAKMARTQDRTLDEVKRLRKKPWDEDDDGEK